MEVCIIDYDDYSGDDTKQKFNKGDMIIEIEGEEITNISIYGEPQNNKKDLNQNRLYLYRYVAREHSSQKKENYKRWDIIRSYISSYFFRSVCSSISLHRRNGEEESCWDSAGFSFIC